MTGASVVTTTVDSAEAAESLAKGIVEARLGACVQIVPIQSVYRWDGEVRVDAEWQCVVKTSANRADELVARGDLRGARVTQLAPGNPFSHARHQRRAGAEVVRGRPCGEACRGIHSAVCQRADAFGANQGHGGFQCASSRGAHVPSLRNYVHSDYLL